MKIIALLSFIILISAAWEDCLTLQVSLYKIILIFAASLLVGITRNLPLGRSSLFFLPLALTLYLINHFYKVKKHKTLLGNGDLLLLFAFSPQFSIREFLLLLRYLALCSLLTAFCMILVHSRHKSKKISELYALRFPLIPLFIPAILLSRVNQQIAEALLY